MMFFLIYNFSSQRQKVADEKNIARIQKEMVKLGQQMAVTMEEYNKVLAINQTIREQLQNEEEKAFKMEESLKVEMKLHARQLSRWNFELSVSDFTNLFVL